MKSGAIEAAQVPSSGQLRDVAVALDRGALRIALVVDPARRLLGIFTDGDFRRALLKGATLEAPLEAHMKRSFVSVVPSAGRAEVLDLMQARRFDVVPIVSAQGLLVGCHQIHDLLGVAVRPNWAVVMAGGRGRRLGSLTGSIPKPMIRVAGRPILERIVLHLVGFGIRRIFVAVNYLANVIEDHFGNGENFGCRIEYLRETKALGTGGALSLLPSTPVDPLLVVNGDLVTQANFGEMLDSHTSDVAATIGTRRFLYTVPFGCLDVDGTKVLELEEKPTLSRLINAGMYVLSPSLVASVPADSEFPMTALIEGALSRQELVRSFEIADDWTDVGQKEQLSEARGEST